MNEGHKLIILPSEFKDAANLASLSMFDPIGGNFTFRFPYGPNSDGTGPITHYVACALFGDEKAELLPAAAAQFPGIIVVELPDVRDALPYLASINLYRQQAELEEPVLGQPAVEESIPDEPLP